MTTKFREVSLASG